MCDTACSGCRSRSLGQGWVLAVGFLVSLTSQPHGSPRTSARSGVLPFLGVVEAGHLPCRVVRFPPPVGPGPVLPVHPVCHVPSVAAAVEAFFAQRDLAAGTCRTYRQALGPLVEAVGADCPVTSLDADQVAAVFEELWAARAPATWNTRRAAIQAFASWCGERWPLSGDLLVGVGPRRRRADNTRAIPYEDLEELWRRRDVPLREKLLWRMLYETAARASEVLALDVGDLDRARRRARIRSKGGSTDMVVWAAPTARLLGRYLAGRDAGPVFLTRWRSRTAPPRGDVYAPTGQARLSYRTAAAEFGRHCGGWTLHQLRHSSLTHLAEAGASAVMLQAKSRHRDLCTLSVYARPGVEAVARMAAAQFDGPGC